MAYLWLSSTDFGSVRRLRFLTITSNPADIPALPNVSVCLSLFSLTPLRVIEPSEYMQLTLDSSRTSAWKITVLPAGSFIA